MLRTLLIAVVSFLACFASGNLISGTMRNWTGWNRVAPSCRFGEQNTELWFQVASGCCLKAAS
jgi:hypothetical protein